MLYYIDFDALTATMVTCVNVKQYDAVFLDNIFGGIDNTMIILNKTGNGNQVKNNPASVGKTEFKIFFPSSQALPQDLSMLDEHLPYELIELVNKYITSSPLTAFIH
jgi:hypothetical protein